MRYVSVNNPEHIVIILSEDNVNVYLNEVGTYKQYLYIERGAPLGKYIFSKQFKPLIRKNHLPKWF